MHSSRIDTARITRSCLLILLGIAPLVGQQRIRTALLRPAPTDTPAVSLQGEIVDVDPPEEKSTALAMFLSAAVPGAGQVYTERYISIPVIWGFGYYFGSQAVDLNDRYKDFRGQFEASVLADTIEGLGNNRLKEIRDFYRDQRDEFLVYLALTYILNIVDAYVGAALYGFDVSPNLNGGAGIRFTVPIGGPPARMKERD